MGYGIHEKKLESTAVKDDICGEAFEKLVQNRMMRLSVSSSVVRTRQRWFMAAAAAVMFPSRVASFHELLPSPDGWKVPSSSHDDYNSDLSKGLQQAGIARIFFLRHGQTARADVDFDRRLTESGRAQARTAGQSFGRNILFPFYPKVLVSPAPRTMETAELFLDEALKNLDEDDNACSHNKDKVELVPVPALYDKCMQPAGSKLFAKIGYAPLQDYLAAPDEEDRAVARDVLGTYASIAVDAIHKTVLVDDGVESKNMGGPSNPSTTLIIVAHAIYLPAAVLGVASSVGCTSDDSLQVPLTVNTQEAEGYLIDLASAKISYLTRPKSS